MKLICYALHTEPPRLRPAPATRDWMDATPQSYAYRCLPLNIANAHGWEILCRSGFSAIWDGGAGKDAITITPDPGTVAPAISHFGSGVLTFHVEAVFRTDPGWSLYAHGSANRPKDGIAALTGLIETDWAPYSFTMNWKFTAAHRTIRFDTDEPFCTIFPIQRRILETVEPEIRRLSDNPELAKRFNEWADGRAQFNAELTQEGSAAQAEKWQKSYYLGLLPDGSSADPDHLIKLRPPGFVDRRGACTNPPKD